MGRVSDRCSGSHCWFRFSGERATTAVSNCIAQRLLCFSLRSRDDSINLIHQLRPILLFCALMYRKPRFESFQFLELQFFESINYCVRKDIATDDKMRHKVLWIWSRGVKCVWGENVFRVHLPSY